MEDSDSSKQSDAIGSDDRSTIIDKITDIVSDRTAEYNNLVLASQIQKALPEVTTIEKRGSLHAALQQISQETFMKTPDFDEDKQKQVTFQLPRKSLKTTEVTLKEYIVPGDEDKLLADSFVRNLPVPIEGKRHYRNSIVSTLRRKSTYAQIQDFINRNFENFKSWFDIWHDTLKLIEGQHGAAIVAYFIFIRWLLFMNFAIFLLNLIFIVIPQASCIDNEFFSSHFNHSSVSQELYIETIKQRLIRNNITEWKDLNRLNLVTTQHIDHSNENLTNATLEDVIEHCEDLYYQQMSNNTRTGFVAFIQNFLQGTGSLESTYLFLGFYINSCTNSYGHFYNIALASLCVLIATFIICLIMMIMYTSVGIQEAFMARNKRSNYYCNEVFSAWDYGIDNSESAAQQHYRFVLEIKTSICEDRNLKKVSARSTSDWVTLYAIRIAINLFIILWLWTCFYLIYEVVVFQLKEQQKQKLMEPGFITFFVQFLSSITVVIFNGISPTVFSMLVPFEKYSAQTVANISMFRNVFLTLSSFIVLLNTFYRQVACNAKDICGVGLNYTCNAPRCWETYVGQQLYKLCMTDLFVYIGVFLCCDFVRYYFTQKYDNKFTRLLGPPIFDLSTEVLAPIFSQTILWFGVFYSPLLSAVMVLKLIIIFYIKKTKILVFCQPTDHSYRASRFNSVFILILLISFFIVLIVQSFAVEGVDPSRGCGPFRRYSAITTAVPENMRNMLSVLTSYWTVAFTTVILCLIVHYYCRITSSQKELAKRLKAELVLQSLDKQYLLKCLAQLTDGKFEEFKRARKS